MLINAGVQVCWCIPSWRNYFVEFCLHAFPAWVPRVVYYWAAVRNPYNETSDNYKLYIVARDRKEPTIYLNSNIAHLSRYPKKKLSANLPYASLSN
jgi:hypothetical protein